MMGVQWGYIMGVGLENFLTLLSQTKTTNHNRNIQSNSILLLNLATKEELQDPNQDTIPLLSSRALSGEVFDGTQGVREGRVWVGDHSLVEISGSSRFLDNIILIEIRANRLLAKTVQRRNFHAIKT